MSINPLTTLGVEGVGQQIIAIGALGTAAFGLVDATKAFGGGISRRGFAFVSTALEPFDAALKTALGDNPDCDWRSLMRAHWINGRPKDEQKSIAVSLIQLGLTVDNAKTIAEAGQVAPAALKAVVIALTNGTDLTPDQLNVLGRFKATIEARIDAAYERADQAYRNSARAAAGLVSILLALAAVWIVKGVNGTGTEYLAAILIGLVAVPLAPIARDIASALSTAARALGRRVAG